MERFISDNTTLDQEQCLLDQNFIKDDKQTVAKYVESYGDVSITGFKTCISRITNYIDIDSNPVWRAEQDFFVRHFK